MLSKIIKLLLVLIVLLMIMVIGLNLYLFSITQRPTFIPPPANSTALPSPVSSVDQKDNSSGITGTFQGIEKLPDSQDTLIYIKDNHGIIHTGRLAFEKSSLFGGRERATVFATNRSSDDRQLLLDMGRTEFNLLVEKGSRVTVSYIPDPATRQPEVDNNGILLVGWLVLND
jgi:hypothetical protein